MRRKGEAENVLLLFGALAILGVFGVAYLVTNGFENVRKDIEKKSDVETAQLRAEHLPPPAPSTVASRQQHLRQPIIGENEGETKVGTPDSDVLATRKSAEESSVLSRESKVLSPGPTPRVWTSTVGTKSPPALFNGLTRDGKVSIIIDDTKRLDIPLSKLADADKAYVFTIVEKDRVRGVTNSGTQYLDGINEMH